MWGGWSINVQFSINIYIIYIYTWLYAYYIHKFAYRFSWIGKGSIQNHFFEIGEVATNLGEWCRRAYCLLCKYQNVPWLWKQLMEEIRLASWGWCLIHGGAGFLPSVSSMKGLNGRKWWILRIFTVRSAQKQFSFMKPKRIMLKPLRQTAVFSTCAHIHVRCFRTWLVFIIRMPKQSDVDQVHLLLISFVVVTPTNSHRFDIVEADPPISQQLQFEELEAASWRPQCGLKMKTMQRSVQHLQCAFGGGLWWNTYVNCYCTYFLGFWMMLFKLRIQCFVDSEAKKCLDSSGSSSTIWKGLVIQSSTPHRNAHCKEIQKLLGEDYILAEVEVHWINLF